jgi:hypothetical protein
VLQAARLSGLAARPAGTLHQFHPQMPAHRFCGTRERAKRHRFIVRFKQPVELRAACFHALGKLGFGDVLVFHQSIELTGKQTRLMARAVTSS